VLDIDGNGAVDIAEMREILMHTGDALTEAQVDDIMLIAAASSSAHDGKVTLEEFMALPCWHIGRCACFMAAGAAHDHSICCCSVHVIIHGDDGLVSGCIIRVSRITHFCIMSIDQRS